MRRRRRRHQAEAAPIGALLARWLAERKLSGDLRPYRIAERWTEIVGERIAARTRPQGLRGGVLTVAVASASWLNELAFLRTELTARINAILGVGWVQAVRLVAGPVPGRARPRPVPPPAPRVPVPPEQLGEVEREVALVSDVPLRHAIRGAWRAGLERVWALRGP
jgi:hypothetical protein